MIVLLWVTSTALAYQLNLLEDVNVVEDHIAQQERLS